MATRIQLRRDTAANWTSVNPVLAVGELGYETDTGKLKLGDGSSTWTALPYYYTTLTLTEVSDTVFTDISGGDFLKYDGTNWVNDEINLGNDTVGDYVEDITAGTGVTVYSGTGAGSNASIAIGQDVGTGASVTFSHVAADLTGSVTGNVVGNVTGNVLGDLTGNADTASTLETGRLIALTGDVTGSATFDGSANIEILTTVAADSVTLGTDTVGDYVEDIIAGTGVSITGDGGEGSTPTIFIGQDVSTGASVTFTHVASNLTGNITGDLTGNADTASTLETARTIELTGDVTGSVSFDGSTNIEISTTISADSVALGTDTSGDYVEDIIAGTGVTITGDGGEGSTPTIFIGQDVAASAGVSFDSVTLGSAPTAASHATTKAYVDNIAAGISWHDAVKLATTAILPNSPVYDNGTSGVGATLTSGSLGRLNVDGTPATTGDRVLVKNQATAAHNGVYVVTEQGSNGVTAWVLTRATDFDGGVTGVIDPGEAVFVISGTVNARQGFVVTSTSSPHIIGTDELSFTQFTGVQAFTAGDGLVQSGNTLNAATANSGRIVVNADSIDLATVSPTSSTSGTLTVFVGGVTVDAYGRVTATSSASVDFSDVPLTGVPTAPTATVGTDTTQVATTEFVKTHVDTYSINLDDVAAKGDLIVGSGAGAIAALTAGTNGYLLKANSATGSGLEWDDLSIGELSNVASGADSGLNGNVLKWVDSEWVPGTLGLTDTSGDYVEDIIAGTGVSITGDGGEGSTPTIFIGQDVSTGASVTFSNVTADVVGNVSGNVSGNVTGNVTGDVSGNVTGTVSDISNHDLEDLGDVSIVSLQTDDFLKWSGSTWTNSAIPPVSSINDISDVVITTETTGQILRYDGSNWTNFNILDNPTFTGTPAAPTASPGTNSTQIATTAYVDVAVSNLVDTAPEALNTLNELAAALGDDSNFSTTVSTSLGLKAPLASPTFTGTVTLPADTNFPERYLSESVASKTLALTDENFVIISNDATDQTVTVPTNASVAFVIGTVLTLIQGAAGVVTISPAAGVTINTSVGYKTREEWSTVTLRKINTDEWHISGDLKA